MRGCDLSVAQLERMAQGVEPFNAEIIDAAVRKLREQSYEMKRLRCLLRQIGNELNALKEVAR